MISRVQSYRPRLADQALTELIRDFPAVLINGPRGVGKTTTARQLAMDEVRLDQPAQAAAFRADPDSALRLRQEPLLLDGWQEVPAVLGAVKRAIDDDPRPGRFILTGSVRAEMENLVWPGTGRLVRLTMNAMTQRELSGSFDPLAPTFVERLSTTDGFPRSKSPLTLTDYVDLALRSSFPTIGAEQKSNRGEIAWMRSYLDQLLTRDAASLLSGADPTKMRTYFEALALNTAGLATDKALYDAAGINAKTAARYDELFNNLFVTEQVPTWSQNRFVRLEKRAKRYLVDPALAATAADVDRAAVLADPNLLGRLLDTFVLAQLRPEITTTERPPRVHHLRTMNGRQEIDLVIEISGGQILALEIKAASAVARSDAKHLIWLRDEVGDRFVAGAVLHTGPDVFELDDKVLAIPISAIWN